MLIVAALIELSVSETDAGSIKARRRVASAVKARLKARFNLSVAEIGDPDDRHTVCIGCVEVGTDPRVMRQRMERVIRYVERLGLAEVVGDDITIARLDELEQLDGEDDEPLPMSWRRG